MRGWPCARNDNKKRRVGSSPTSRTQHRADCLAVAGQCGVHAPAIGVGLLRAARWAYKVHAILGGYTLLGAAVVAHCARDSRRLRGPSAHGADVPRLVPLNSASAISSAKAVMASKSRKSPYVARTASMIARSAKPSLDLSIFPANRR